MPQVQKNRIEVIEGSRVVIETSEGGHVAFLGGEYWPDRRPLACGETLEAVRA